MQTVSDDIDYAAYLANRDGQKIRPASDWRKEVKDRFAGTASQYGEVLPWEKTHNAVQLRPGEVSVWAGINGHGKSLILGQAMLWLLPKTKALIASMEMKPEATVERMIRQASGQHYPACQYIDNFLSWTDDRLWIYDQQDSVATEKILGMVAYGGEQLGIKHIVIDSLMKCGIAPDDYGSQKRFVDRLCWLAKDLNIHVHLVAHMRKREREGHVPDKFDIKGTSEISDLVDNVFIMHRNKDKEAKADKGEEVDSGIPDASLIVAKQRHGEWEGKIALWFDPKSDQYIPRPEGGALPWPTPEDRFSVFREAVA